MESEKIIKEIETLVASGFVTYNNIPITYNDPSTLEYSWRLDNNENIGSSYHSEISNTETVEKVVSFFFSNNKNVLENIQRVSKYDPNEPTFLHLYLKPEGSF